MNLLEPWRKCVEIARDILNQPDGDWTHELDGQPVRYVMETVLPTGVVRVHYRAEGSAGSIPKNDWQRRAMPLVGQVEFPF